ncbi:AbrB family transcriptional regulator [Cuniculiplasma divulgatum]|uniref:VapB antitoxin n=1 Tax=Cuniculiplasma divulgatum TaxID=1673428 RepID=A0A1N5WFX0_9ARCH|nr:AbrB family transcriptional regulator [Cuniculiplasma divulgatum]SIM84202.1 VapB antitoxin [Cuniculiplasma divulgatum]
MAMIEEAKLDEKGRINIGQESRTLYGDRFYVIKLSGEILLIPKPKDPVTELRKWGKKLGLGKQTARDTRMLAVDEANKEVEERTNRRQKDMR